MMNTRKGRFTLLWIVIIVGGFFIMLGGFFGIFFGLSAVILLIAIIIVLSSTKCPSCGKLGAMEKTDREETHGVSERRSTETVQEKVGTVSTYVGLDAYHTDIYRDKEVEHLDKIYDVTNRYKCACCGYEMTKRENESYRSY
jgi:hypothetical protein